MSLVALVSCRHKMSGRSSRISRATISIRARTELTFHEAILMRLMATDLPSLHCLCERSEHPRPQPAACEMQMAPAPGAWSEGRRAFVTQGILRARVTGGNPKQGAGSRPI